MTPRVTSVEGLLNPLEPDATSFAKRWGAAALLHPPSEPEIDLAMLKSGTVGVPSDGQWIGRLLVMLREFRQMTVDFLPATLEGSLRLGRSLDADLVLPDPSVSKLHATMRWRRGQFWLSDDRSKNKTYVNGYEIDRDVLLSAGDTLGLGKVELLFVTSDILFLQLTTLPGAKNARARR